MKIYYERSGGFLGRSISTTLDTNQLPPELALSLLEKVDNADFFALPETVAGDLEGFSGADCLHYKVTVEIAGVQHTVETSEMDAPDELQPLLQELAILSRGATLTPNG
ncbi:MAG: hypothetical protein KJ046_07915 [Anaerolineae bacterium]|nr:hypothetical protein [Anaerolineae bacterium]RIK23570.1 MAG: hypothetical protein DCC51_03200 [Anaerolineae bacterium]